MNWDKTCNNLTENIKKESNFKVDFRKFDYVKPVSLKKN